MTATMARRTTSTAATTATRPARWIELPTGFDPATHVALSVAGDSMAPFLNDGDVILVDTRKVVTRGCIAIAGRADGEYVMKHVTRCGKRTLRLSSFNSEYVPFTVGRAAVVGVVVARLQPEEQAA